MQPGLNRQTYKIMKIYAILYKLLCVRVTFWKTDLNIFSLVWKQIPKNQACIDQCVETSCDFLQSLTKDFSLEKFKIILQATDLLALTWSDPVSLIEDILMAASQGDEN